MLLSIFTGALLLCGLVRADSATGRCGPQGDNLRCDSDGTVNSCCSQCGDTTGHCETGCQAGFGKCTTTTPSPLPSIGARPKLGKVPYGQSILDCNRAGTIALTYDDGPYDYTAGLLDILKDKGVKATFFVAGNNIGKGAVDAVPEWSQVIKRAYDEGHQIASHTWDHLDLNSLSDSDQQYQMVRLEQALIKIIGRYPTYMRPPFIECDSRCEATMGELGYHVIIWDFSTDDYNNATPDLIENSKQRVRDVLQANNPANSDLMSIAHDIHFQTVYNLTSFQIDEDKKRGFKHVRLGECLNDPEANWYRTKL